MSEQMLEELREYNAMKRRVVLLISWLDESERKQFNTYAVKKMLDHIISGGGWL